MGAWGTGMLANDTALDAVHVHGPAIQKIVASKGRGLLPLLRKVAKEDHCDDMPDALFGVCQQLLNQGVRFPEKAVRFLWPYLGQALTSTWRFHGSDDVAKGIGHFAQHLVNPRAAAITKKDNKGLLVTIMEKFPG